MGILTDILKEIPVNAVLRSKLEDLEKKYEALEAENTKLKEENQKLQSKVNELTSSGELCENEVNILKLLSPNYQFSAATIATHLDLSLTKTEYYLDKMEEGKYIDRRMSMKDKSSIVYYLSRQGRQYLVENDLVE